jgi:hypothetical protein
MLLELPMSNVESEKPITYYDIGKGTQNKINNAVVEILRMPDIGKCVPGASIGEGVKGRIVFQYNGPLTIRWVMDEAENARTNLSPAQQAIEPVSAEGMEQPVAKKKKSTRGKQPKSGLAIWDEEPAVKKTKKAKKTGRKK